MEFGNGSVLLEIQDAIATITLNRPERYNAVNHELSGGLIEALVEVKKNDAVRAVLLTGAGKGFCAGADLAVFGTISPAEAEDYICRYYGTITRQMMDMPKPIIGAINGPVAGVGAALALACDVRIMAESASFRYAFINIGLGPDGGAGWFLSRMVGYSRAFEIAVEGEKIPANRCLELGLTNKVVPDAELTTAAQAWAQKLSQRPTVAVGITKQALHHASTHTLAETIALEARNQITAFQSQDHKEGVQAFLEKRHPNFKGK